MVVYVIYDVCLGDGDNEKKERTDIDREKRENREKDVDHMEIWREQ